MYQKLKFLLFLLYYPKVFFDSSFRMRGWLGLNLINNTKSCRITLKSVQFNKNCRINIGDGALLHIGSDCFFNNDCSLNCLGTITIGDSCIFGENVRVYDHNHIFGLGLNFKKSGFKIKNVKVGNNCWISSGVQINSGVEIGDNVVIGANIVVNKDIPSNSLVTIQNNMKIESLR